MAELWDQRDGESDAAHQALRDYCRMGVRRSLSKLLAQYTRQASNKRSTKLPPTQSSNTLETWSHSHEWVKRAKAYDVDQQKKLDAEIEASRKKWIEDEITNAKAELQRFKLVRGAVNLSFKEQVSETKTPDPDDPTKTIVTRTFIEHIDVSQHAALTRWLDNISAIGRRAHGLPEKITEAHIDPNIDADKMYKAYYGISPDDWDEPLNDDTDAGDSAV